MPTYDYQCRACGALTEVIHSMLEDGPSVCERCGGALRRVLHPAGIIFKGSGFYKTDSRTSGGGSSRPDASSPATSTGTGSAKDGSASPPSSPGTSSSDGGSGTKSSTTDATTG